MSSPDFSTPAFGEPVQIIGSADTLAFLGLRRSASALSLTTPAPTPQELARILAIASRAPDHGKLAPWRFVILQGEPKARFVAGLEVIASARPDAAKALAKLGKIRVPPVTVAVISHLVDGDIPPWEQELSAGAVCMLLAIAAQASGYGANWITDWYAYDPNALRLLGVVDGERVAGYLHLGTPTESPLERVRPELSAITCEWRG